MGACIVASMLFIILSITEASDSATFSLKIIHRFSDEARSIWASRNGGKVPWPDHRGIEYFRLLLSNDVRRERLKLASQNQLLVPSEGSRTFYYGNDLGWLHYTWIDIGTPNVSFFVALDTGSDLFWVPCQCIQCAPLSSLYPFTLDRDLSEYNPSLSSTSKHLVCGHHLCEFGPECSSPNESCPYRVEYSSVNTSTSGFLFEDKLNLVATVGGLAPKTALQAAVIIGCGRKQTGSYLDDIAPDGVMGLGPGVFSVPSMLAKSGLVQHSFSFCFDKTSSGRIFFGDQGPATQKSTRFSLLDGKSITYIVDVEHYCVGSSCVKQTAFQAQVDSGSSFTYLPYEIYKKISSEFDKQVNATRIEIEDFPYCYKARYQESLLVPAMKLMLSVNQSFVVENPMFIYPLTQGVSMYYCLGVLPLDGDIGLIGQNFMMGYRMVFDWENFKLGWSHSNCEDTSGEKEHIPPPPYKISPNPLPTNDQPKASPNRSAVAPAIAGRAPPMSSASLHGCTRWHLISLALLLLFSLSTDSLIL